MRLVVYESGTSFRRMGWNQGSNLWHLLAIGMKRIWLTSNLLPIIRRPWSQDTLYVLRDCYWFYRCSSNSSTRHLSYRSGSRPQQAELHNTAPPPKFHLLSLLSDTTVVERVKLSLCWTKHHAMKAFRGSGGIAPCIIDHGTRWRWVVGFTPRPLYPHGKSPWYPLDRRLGGPQSRSGRGGEEKNSQPPPGIEP
jgi:hypothetical protein